MERGEGSNAVPEKFRSVTPSLTLKDLLLMMGDENPNCRSAESMGGSPVGLYVYVPDADAVFKQAVAAGAAVTMPVADMFWGGPPRRDLLLCQGWKTVTERRTR